MITARIFEVFLHGESIDRVYFIGAEYNAETVRLFLLEHEKMDKDIEVKQIRENEHN